MRSARRCRRCGARTVLVLRVRVYPVGRVRTLSCYSCGETERTVEVSAEVVADVLRGETGQIRALWESVAPLQTVMEEAR